MPQMKLPLARQPNGAQATKHKNLKILEIPKKHLGILEFPTMSSSGLTRGSLYGILDYL